MKKYTEKCLPGSRTNRLEREGQLPSPPDPLPSDFSRHSNTQPKIILHPAPLSNAHVRIEKAKE